jgi:hypothetical protein
MTAVSGHLRDSKKTGNKQTKGGREKKGKGGRGMGLRREIEDNGGESGGEKEGEKRGMRVFV